MKYPIKDVKHIPRGHPFNDTTSSLELAWPKFSTIKTRFVTMYPPDAAPRIQNISDENIGNRSPIQTIMELKMQITVMHPTITGFLPNESAKNPDKNAPITPPSITIEDIAVVNDDCRQC